MSLADVVNQEWIKRYGGEPTDRPEALESRVVQLGLDRDCWLSNAKNLQNECNRLEAMIGAAGLDGRT